MRRAGSQQGEPRYAEGIASRLQGLELWDARLPGGNDQLAKLGMPDPRAAQNS